jgi:hypothetical protein
LIKRIFDAYRYEADTVGFAAGPEHLALRRRVTVAPTTERARVYAHAVTQRLKSFVAEYERLSTQALDAPAPSGGFTLSDDEFITGTPKDAAQTIIEQCRAVGAGHFLTVLNWSAPVDEVAQAHELWSRGHPLITEIVNIPMSDVSVALDQHQISRCEKLIRPYVRRTPVIEIDGADAGVSSRRLSLKLELLQHSGSFKARGAFANLLLRKVPAAGVAAASGGNHGAAVAYAAMTRSVCLLTGKGCTHPRIRSRSCYRGRSVCGCAGGERGMGKEIGCDARACFRSV